MKKLYRSRRDSKLFGLCGGLAEMMNVDSTLLRVVLVVTTFFTGGTLIPIYFIACLVIPKEPPFDPFYNPYSYSNGSGYGSSHQYPPYGSGNGTHTSGSSYGYAQSPVQQPTAGQSPSGAGNIDEMMRDLEKKALQKEIEELRSKLAQYEKGNKE